jgi:eukaryotic-like serine/threonine-protein kinase
MTPTRWQQIARLFDEASELEPSGRAAWLDVSCAKDAELRREVEQMLAADEQANEFMNQPAAELVAAQLVADQTLLSTGSQIAHFEILNPLGAGAMGEVYLARDTRLERQVALKLLPTRFTQDAGRLKRFARESRAASALNHPNIITVYEVGADGAHHFIAAEYVEGVTLRERLANGPLPCAEALSIATQIVAALGAAHTAGIVHRDIKPENVMLRADGVIKVLDFGIAKLLQKSAPADATARPHSTEQGTVIGTPGYMSPEQARGLEVDARTDIFSCGVVLYEILAGHAPFRGATKADIIAALLERVPEPLNVHAGLNTIVGKSLTKDAAQRYQTATAMLADLQAVELGRGALTSGSLLRWSWPRLAVAAGVLLAVLIAGGLAWRFSQRTKLVSDWGDPSKLRFTRPFNTRLGLGGQLSRPAVAPDANRIAFSMGGDGQMRIIVKDLSSGAESRLSDEASQDADPVWSPDGKRIAVLSQGTTRREIRTLPYPLAAAGGAQVVLKELNPAAAVDYLLAWLRTPRGERIYYESYYNLYALNPVSGQVERLTQFDQQRPVFRAFRPSPQGDRIAYLEPQGKSYDLMLQPVYGAPVTLWQSAEPISSPSWFPDGQRLAFIINRGDTSQIFVLRLDTRTVEQVTSGSENYSEVVVGPDGQRIFALSSRENANIFAWDFGSGTEVGHTSEFGLQIRPEPAPVGQQLLFQALSSFARGKMDIFVKPLVPGGQPHKLVTEAQHARWSPDGAAVAFIRFVLGKHELWRVDASGASPRRLVESVLPARSLPTPYLAYHTDYAWAPDGQSLAYFSRKTGAYNLWRVAHDGTNDTNLTGNTDPKLIINSPCWSPQGKQLAYLASTTAANDAVPSRSVWLNEAGKNEVLFTRSAPLHLVGWMPTGRVLLVAAGTLNAWGTPQTIELFRLDLAHRQPISLLKIAAAYLPTLRLARDGRNIVVVTRQQGRDNLDLIAVDSRTVKRLTSNTDPTVFYSSPAWAADGRSLFYSKQTSWQFLDLLEKQF